MSTISREDDVTILVVEDDDGHARLIQLHFAEAGIVNEIIRLHDGQEALDFFFNEKSEKKYSRNHSYLLLLDICLPKVNGVEVLRQIKDDEHLSTIPVIMLTTTDDPREVEACYRLGCNVYITKPVQFDSFSNVLHQLGLFLKVIRIAPVA